MNREDLKAACDALAATLPGPTMIGRYKVELDAMYDTADPARGVWVDCSVTSPKGAGNSLACLQGEGQFDETGESISEAMTDRIEAFAVKHGY